MARKNIQGITIEIGGDTTKLQSALKGVESKIKDTQAALKDVNKLLKMDPGNVELLTQKQGLLKDSISATEEKLQTLRDAADQANEALANGDMSQAQYDALQREIIETEQDLRALKDEMRDFGSVAAQQIAAAGEKVKELGDKITNVGTSMTKYVTGPIVAVGAASVAAFSEVDDGLDIIVKKTGATGEALDDMQKRAMNLATSIPTDFGTAGTAIGEVNTRFGLTGQALEDLSAKFIKFAALNDTDVTSSVDNVQAAMAAFGVDAAHAGNVLDVLNAAAQETGVDVMKLSGDLTSNAAVLREMGFSINSATGFLARLNKNGLDSSAVLTGMKKAMQNAVKEGKSVNQALDEMQYSIMHAKSETEAMQIATELFGAKAAPSMVKAIREGRISFDELGNAVTNFGGSVDNTFEETLDPMDEFKTAMNELKIVGMELVEAAAPLIKDLANLLKTTFANIRSWWEGLSPFAQQSIIKLAGIAAAVGPVLAAVGKVTSVVGTVMTMAPKIAGVIGTVKTALSSLWGVLAANPIGIVIAVVAALVAAFIHFWNTSEEFRNFWINLWENIKNIASQVGQAIAQFWSGLVEQARSIWSNLGDSISGIWEGIKNKAASIWEGITSTIRNAIERVKSFFNFHWELPKIKMPHFKIQGSFSLNPPSVPHLAVDWYRKAMSDGMILSSPTVLPAANGTMRGYGDAGPEAVVGVSSLRSMISSAVASASQRASGGATTVILQLDGKELARASVPYIDAEVQRVGVRLAKA